jgi:2-C-methyl-D-erythritol 4-phosphate cytidylyltransferase
MAVVWSIVVAAGGGSRFGGRKQFAELAGRSLVEWSVEACCAVSDGVVLVLPEGAPEHRFGAQVAVAGGPTRSASVRNGLAAVPADADIVIVHDAARPLASRSLFVAVLAALEDPAVAGALCACPVTDTVKEIDSVVAGADGVLGDVVGTLDRARLVAVQTPQAFRAAVLREAHATGDDATDDAALVEGLGATVRVVAGDVRNLKVTTPADLAYAEHLLVS